MRRYLDGRAMDDVAIERLRKFQTEAIEMHPDDGYQQASAIGEDTEAPEDVPKNTPVISATPTEMVVA